MDIALKVLDKKQESAYNTVLGNLKRVNAKNEISRFLARFREPGKV